MNREILRLAIPSILANITVSLVGMVDLAIAGHLDSQAAMLIGGIAVGSMLFDLLYWNFLFLKEGTGGFTAQAYGRQDWTETRRILLHYIFLAIVSGIGLIAIQWPFAKLALNLVGSSEAVKEMALQYFFIRIWAAPASLCLFAIKGWFIGMQDSFSSMATDIVVNGVNVAASILLARAIGFAGIPLGTVIAQYTGLFFALAILCFKYREIVVKGLDMKDLREAMDMKKFSRASRMNFDLIIRAFGMIAIYIGFTVISAHLGDTLLAVCSIMMKIMMLFSYFTDGFAYAGEALTGKFIGMKDRENLYRAVRLTFAWSLGIGLFFIGIYAFGGVPLFRLMTSDDTVVEAARPFLWWMCAIPLFGCPAFTWDGIYVGATESKALRDATILAVLAFFGVWGVCLILSLNPVDSLMAGYFAHLAARTMYQTAKSRKMLSSVF
ncbi:MAG: MATE family efflux transporter [Bacteroidales bacterium]|nr:MATE family efflux transporter [Bacteroidales bacterium]